MTNTQRKICVAMGLLMIVAAICLIAYNWYEDRIAAEYTEVAVLQIEEAQSAIKKETSVKLSQSESINTEKTMPSSDQVMTTVEINDLSYLGILEISSLGLSLPVQSEWHEENLIYTPCCYEGDVYSNDMIIAGHNYQAHFGKLDRLTVGDKIRFTDMEGNCFAYIVSEIRVLKEDAVEEMKNGEWDLTLFTCTTNGRERTTVRCQRTI